MTWKPSDRLTSGNARFKYTRLRWSVIAPGGDTDPGREAHAIEIAGYERASGEWVNAEDAAGNIVHHATPETLEVSSRVVVRWTDEDGETHYRTTSHLTRDFDVRDWLRTNYGVQFT